MIERSRQAELDPEVINDRNDRRPEGDNRVSQSFAFFFLRPAGVQAKLCYFPIDSGAGLIDVNPVSTFFARIQTFPFCGISFCFPRQSVRQKGEWCGRHV
jgi:hypothetical protein